MTTHQDRRTDRDTFCRELGLTPEQAAELRRQIEYCEASGPQRWELAGRVEVKRP